jgi:hypothetical protein
MSHMTLEEAKSLVAGPLGQEMAKFALRFCKPLYFGPPPSRQHPAVVNSGTASLLRFGDDVLAVTCSHVIKGYRRKLAEDDRCLFAIANCYFDDPLGQLVAEDSAIDAAVVRLTMKQANQITRNSAGIGEAFYEVNPKSGKLAKVGDFVAYGGFPGCLRQVTSFDELSFGSYSSGACRVTDVHSDYMTCEFEREFWIKSFPEPEPQSLRGLSGGPAFMIRHRPSGVISYEYAGLIYSMHESTESLFIRQARALPLGWEVSA